jgi:hypothetical protein
MEYIRLNNRPVFWAVFLGFILLGILSLSCISAEKVTRQFIVVGIEKIANQELATIVEKYYEAERNKDWLTTYKMRSKSYQRLVPFENYKQDMEKGVADWKLLQIEIMDSSYLENGETEIRIRFTEEFGPHAAEVYFGGRVPSGVNTRTETTKWIQIDNRWICVDAAQRGHLPY